MDEPEADGQSQARGYVAQKSSSGTSAARSVGSDVGETRVQTELGDELWQMEDDTSRKW
jgi:hypothetical protein